ncbi:MAG: flippase [Bacteroidota bacterium]|nr:flippase [Bacteroidota bacterium]
MPTFQWFNVSPIVKKTIANLTWLSVDRIIRLFGAVIVNAWLTRYLGPEQNGILGYTLAFVGIFSPIAVLGMDSIVVRDVVRESDSKNEILGSSFILRLLGGVCLLFLSSVSIFILRPNDGLLQLLVIVTSSTFLFQSFDVIDYWFQSQVQSKYTVFAKNFAFFLSSAAKIICLLLGQELYVFVIINAVEIVIAAVGLVIVYHKKASSLREWTFSWIRVKNLLHDSWPITITNFALLAQSRIDQVMIGEFLTNSDVGYYAAAQKVSEPLGFIPMIIMSSVYPIIIKTRTWSMEEYYKRLTNLYRLMFALTLAVCIPFAFFSKSIIYLLYGQQFAPSALILSLLVWSRFFGAFGVARSIFISAENLFVHALLSSLAGVSVNFVANYFLIQRFGVFGSIAATYISGIVTIFVMDGLSKRTRVNFVAMIKGVTSFYKFSLKN